MKNFVGFLIVLLACLAGTDAHAQFIGYTSPQTTEQVLATNVACTGVAQIFPINNLGQTQHYISIISSGSQTLSAQLQGIDAKGNVFAISEAVVVPSGAGGRRATVFGTGYFPQVQASVSCLPSGGGALFTLSYSGVWGTFNSGTGDYLAAQIDKTAFTNAPGNTNVSSFFQTPFGNSGGTVFFQYSGAPAVGGSLTVGCQGSGIGTVLQIMSVTLLSNTLVQSFPVPNTSCTFITVSYLNSGAAATVTADFVFAEPGQQIAADPCGGAAFKKTNTTVSVASPATTLILTAVAGLSTYVCGYSLSQVATAGTVSWIYGTGASCTGAVPLNGPQGVTASQPFGYSGPGTVFTVPSNALNNLCLTTTGTGSLAGLVTYVSAP